MEAQDLCYDAYEHGQMNYPSKLALAREALRIDPQCLDAHSIVASCLRQGPPEMKNLQAALDICKAGLATRSDVGKVIMSYEDIENRPYLRLAFSKVEILKDLDEMEAAAAEARRMLPLSRGCYRDEWSSLFFVTQDWSTLAKLFRYEKNKWSMMLSYNKLLFDYHRHANGGGSAITLNESLLRAIQKNRYVPSMLFDGHYPPGEMKSYSPGKPDEAGYYLTSCGGDAAWRSIDGAVTWLKQQSMHESSLPAFPLFLRLLENGEIMVVVRRTPPSLPRRLVCTRRKAAMPYPLCGGPIPEYHFSSPNDALSMLPAGFEATTVDQPLHVFLPFTTRENRDEDFVSFQYGDVIAVPFWKAIEEDRQREAAHQAIVDEATAEVEAEDEAEEARADALKLQRIAALPPPPASILLDSGVDAVSIIVSFLDFSSLCAVDVAFTSHSRRPLWLEQLRLAVVPALDLHLHSPVSLRWTVMRRPRVSVVKLDPGQNALERTEKTRGKLKFKQMVDELNECNERLEHVRVLDFNGNSEVTSKFVQAFISKCPNVQTLSLESLGQQNVIEDVAIAAIGAHCLHLKFLNLGQLNVGTRMFKFGGRGPYSSRATGLQAIASGCPALEELHLDAYDVVDADFEDIGIHCTRLKRLQLECVNVTPTSLRALSRCAQLEDLHMSPCIQAFEPALWAQAMDQLAAGCTQLRCLTLLEVTPGMVEAVGRHCRNLEDLSLTTDRNGHNFVAALSAVAQRCTRLTSIRLRKSIATDDGLACFANGSCRLKHVDLDGYESTLTVRAIVTFLDALAYSLENVSIAFVDRCDAVLSALSRRHGQLETLYLQGHSILQQPGAMTTFLSQATALKSLGLHNCRGVTKQLVEGWRRQYPKLDLHALSETYRKL